MSIRSRKPLVGSVLVIVLLFAVSFLSGHRLPLYDGVAFPDEPYRYVKPPYPSLRTKQPPTIATAEVAVQESKSKQDVPLASQETGPQVAAYFVAGSLQAPANATKISIMATPLAPSGPQPAEGPIAGNIYHLSATSDTGPMSLITSTATPTNLDLRLPQGYAPGATMEYRAEASGAWKKLLTLQDGSDIYGAAIYGLGDFALVDTTDKNLPPPPNKATRIVLILSVVLLVGIGIILGLIRNRTAVTTEHKDK